MALLVSSATKLEPGDFVTIEGLKDKDAGAVHTMARMTFGVPSHQWPPPKKNLVLAWSDGMPRTGDADSEMENHLVHHGKAFLDERGRMKLQGGWFDLTGAVEGIGKACHESGAFTFEFILTPHGRTDGPQGGTVATLSGHGAELFRITQRKEELYLSVTTSVGSSPELELGKLLPDVENHVLVLLEADTIRATLNGVESRKRSQIVGRLQDWHTDTLRFGAAMDGSLPWHGRVERVLFYSEALPPVEIRQHAYLAQATIKDRKAPHQWKAKLRLVQASPLPTLEEILPYKNALVRHLYEEVSDEGKPAQPARRIAITHWAWLDGQPMPAQKLRVGEVVNLPLQGLEEHSELATLFVKDTLDPILEAEEAYDATDWNEDIQMEPARPQPK
jgi:hypothetical protein